MHRSQDSPLTRLHKDRSDHRPNTVVSTRNIAANLKNTPTLNRSSLNSRLSGADELLKLQ